MEARLEDKKLYRRIIWIFTIVVYLLVGVMHNPDFSKLDGPVFTSQLPLLHALLNGSCFVLLIASLLSIKKGNVDLHRKLNTAAMALSLVFLLSYVVYHLTNENAVYEGGYPVIYKFIVFSHISLAGLSLPGILFAYYRGLTNDLDKHRKIVKAIYPIWLYVALTGVLVYVLLKPYY